MTTNLFTYRSRWIIDPLFPLLEEIHEDFAEVERFGNIWVQDDATTQIRLANSTAGWQAHWHGDVPGVGVIAEDDRLTNQVALVT